MKVGDLICWRDREVEVLRIPVRSSREDRKENVIRVVVAHRLGWHDWSTGGWNCAGYYALAIPIETDGKSSAVTMGRQHHSLMFPQIRFSLQKLKEMSAESLKDKRVFKAIARVVADGGYVIQDQVEDRIRKEIDREAVRT